MKIYYFYAITFNVTMQDTSKQKEAVNLKKSKKIKSLPDVKSSEPCPEGYVRSTRTGKCIKDKKYKANKARKVNVDDSILKILKEIKK